MHGVHEGVIGERCQVTPGGTARSQLGRHGLRARDRSRRVSLGGGRQPGQMRAELAPVGLGEDGAEDGHPERTRYLPGDVGERRA